MILVPMSARYLVSNTSKALNVFGLGSKGSVFLAQDSTMINKQAVISAVSVEVLMKAASYEICEGPRRGQLVRIRSTQSVADKLEGFYEYGTGRNRRLIPTSMTLALGSVAEENVQYACSLGVGNFLVGFGMKPVFIPVSFNTPLEVSVSEPTLKEFSQEYINSVDKAYGRVHV